MIKPRKKRKPTKKKAEVPVKKVTGSEMEPLIDEMVRLVGDGGDPRMTKALVAHHMGVSVYESGMMAGYAESYCKTRLGTKIKEGKFRERMRAITKRLPGVFKEINDLSLLHLGEAQIKAVKMYRDDPELLIKFPQLARQIKGVSGLLNDEIKPQPTISIGSIEKVQVMMSADLERTIRDAEVVGAKKFERIEDTRNLKRITIKKDI